MTPTFLVDAMSADRALPLLAKIEQHLGLPVGRQWAVVDRHGVTVGVETQTAILWVGTSDGARFSLSIVVNGQRTHLEGSAPLLFRFLYLFGLSRLELP